MSLRAGAAGLVALALWATVAGAEPRKSAMVFAGPVSLNDWGDLVTLNDVEYSDAVITGVVGGLTWNMPSPRWQFSMEVQVNKYFGSQDSWEFNVVPAMFHYVPKRELGPLQSLGFGLGFSYASEPPAVELARGDETSQEKWYWTLEAAFDTENPNREVVLRIHHRSTGSSTIGTGRSTNAVAIGLRQYF
jgi:hypothetical protein